MIHTIKASGPMKIDGKPAKAESVLAKVITDYPLDSILAAIRCSQVTIDVAEEPKAVPERVSVVAPPGKSFGKGNGKTK